MASQWYNAVHATKRFRLGTIKKDITGAEFMYCKGVGATATYGTWALIQESTFTPVQTTNASSTGMLGISCSSVFNGTSVTPVAASGASTSQFGWYLVKGNTKLIPNLVGQVAIDTGSTNLAALSTSSATTGRVVGGGVVATKTIVGAWAQGVSAANVGDALLNYPQVAGGSLA